MRERMHTIYTQVQENVEKSTKPSSVKKTYKKEITMPLQSKHLLNFVLLITTSVVF